MKCPCTAVLCELHGRCRECVAVHRANGDHIPACLQPMLNEKLRQLVGIGEMTTFPKEKTPDEYRLYVKQCDRESADASD